jgi:hypothetical protein
MLAPIRRFGRRADQAEASYSRSTFARKYRRTATTMTSGGNRKPANAAIGRVRAHPPARPQPESDAGWSRQLTPDLVAR